MNPYLKTGLHRGLVAAFALAASCALRAGDFDRGDDYAEPRYKPMTEVVVGFGGDFFSTGETHCDYWGYNCVTFRDFELRNTAGPRASFHFAPVRHFQLNLNVDHQAPRVTTTAQDCTSGTCYDVTVDLGKLKLTRAGLVALYRAPLRRADFYLGGGLEFPVNSSFSTDSIWTCQDPPGCTLGDVVNEDVSAGYNLTMGVDIRMSRAVWFNIEAVVRGYDLDLNYQAAPGRTANNPGLKLRDSVSEANLNFGVGFRF